MKMTNKSQIYFEKVAREWDSLRSSFFTTLVREAAIRKAYLRPEAVVADVGAGTGFMTAGLAPLVKKVHVVDGSEEMLMVARQNLSSFSNLEYHLTVDGLLPFREASLDAVFANMYLHHCSDPLAAILEMATVLRPGGRLVITDLDAHSQMWLKEDMADTWLGFERAQIREWFQQADMVNVLVESTLQSCCAKSQREDSEAGEARINIFVATGVRRISHRNVVRTAYSALAQDGCYCGSPANPVMASCCSVSEANAQSLCCQDEKIDSSRDGFSITEYSAEDRASVPEEAKEIFLGCGNPIALANLKPGEVVLDVGSGGGMDAFLAAKRVSPGGMVIGVDMTTAMIERARQTAEKAGITNIDFRLGQAEALPVPDGTVDVVLSNCVINLCDDKGAVFQEIYRILKPGGRLEVSDVMTDIAFSLEMRLNAEEWSACVVGALPEQEYLDLMAQAGFVNIQVRRSAVIGKKEGVQVYNAIISACKPALLTG